MEESKDKLDSSMGSLSKALDDREIWKYRIYSTMLTSSATVFSIVVSISVVSGISTSSILFFTAVGINGLSILSCMLLILDQLFLSNKTVQSLSDEVSKKLLQHLYQQPSSSQWLWISSSFWHKYVQRCSFLLYASWVILYATFIIHRGISAT